MREPRVACPFCASDRVQLISLFGSQLLLSQFRCLACGSYFEGLRDLHQEPGGTDRGRRTEV